MDTKQIRRLLKDGASVVLLEEGLPPLVVSELQTPQESEQAVEPTLEVPIASRWPKTRSILEDPKDHLLERLNKEILALKDQIAQQEDSVGGPGIN